MVNVYSATAKEAHVKTRKTAAWVALLLLLLPTSVLSTTYVIPPDYSIACLDMMSGTLLWRTKPETFTPNRISVAGDIVVAYGDQATYYCDVQTGKLLQEPATPEDMGFEEVGPLTSLNQNLSASRSVTFPRPLEHYVADLHVANGLAIFTFASGGSIGGGEVYAYSIQEDRLAWEFDASNELPDVSEYEHTEVEVDGQRILVSVDQVLFALSIDSGNILWMTKLPRQVIRRYDLPWTKIGRRGDMLFVACYEDLFAVRADDGQLLWSFDPGPFGRPWPTIKDEKVYLATREGPVDMTSTTVGGGGVPKKAISAVKVVRDETSPVGYSIEFISRRDVPPEEEVWWSLKPPPLPGHHVKFDRVILKLIDTHIDHRAWEPITKLDISLPLHTSGRAYIKFTGSFGRKAVLLKDGVKILEDETP